MFGTQNPIIELALAINIAVLGFNLLPIKGLDGGRILLTLRSWVYTKLNHEKLVVTNLYVPAAYFFSYSLYFLLFVLGNGLLENVLALTPQALQHGYGILMQYDLWVRLGWL
jgi:Zn-dependent protease